MVELVPILLIVRKETEVFPVVGCLKMERMEETR